MAKAHYDSTTPISSRSCISQDSFEDLHRLIIKILILGPWASTPGLSWPTAGPGRGGGEGGKVLTPSLRAKMVPVLQSTGSVRWPSLIFLSPSSFASNLRGETQLVLTSRCL